MLAVLFCFGWTTVSAEEAETTKVTIHYKQKEGDTTNWSLWVWGKGGDGARFEFTDKDDFGQVAEIVLPGQYSKVGVIVSTEDWRKDGGDRFIDISNGFGELFVTGDGNNAPSGGQNMTYLWAIIGLVTIPVLLHVFEYNRSKRLRGSRPSLS
jgi:pullulanase